jgi:type I restriction enzyme S subunit
MIEGPYKLPKGWRWVRLGEVCIINPRRSRIFREPNKPTSFIPMSAIDEETGTITAPEVRPFKELSKGYTYFEENDILFAKITPCMENGKVAIARGLTDRIGFGSTEFHVLRPKSSVFSEWIWLFIRRKQFREDAKKFFRGGVGQQRVPQEFLEHYPIPLPPLEEQKRIVARIEELMDRIKEAKKSRQETKKQTELLWQSVLAETFPQPDKLLPPGWKWIRLGEICSKPQYGLTQSASTTPVGPKFLRITDITSGYIDWEKVPYCRISQHELDKYKLDEGDLLFARSGSIGATILIKEKPPYDAVFASYLIRVRLNKFLVYPEFLYWFTRSLSGQEQLIPRGATQKNINAKFIQSLLIPLPPLEEQKRIANYLREVHEKIKELKEVQTKTEEEIKLLEQSILEKAFRGEL